MKRFATVFPFVEHGAERLAIGRLVANHDFVKALLRHGDFDEFLFANPSIANLRAFRQLVGTWSLPPGRAGRLAFLGYPQLARGLQERPPDVMHLGGWGHFMPGLHYVRAGLADARWPITAVIHSLHGREPLDHAIRLTHAQMRPTDAVFCTSLDGRLALRRLIAMAEAITSRRFNGQLLHLPLGVDDDLVAGRGDRGRARARLRIDADAVVLLVLGRMTPTQKMDVGPLLRCFARQILPRAGVPTVLALAGGAAPADLELVREGIRRHGLDPHVRLQANFPAEQKADVLAMADVLVAPTDNTQETFGLSLLEALGSGVPVVASRFDGYKDLVRDGVDGFLVDAHGAPDDPMETWADLMDPNVAQLVQSQGVAVDLDQLADRVLALIADGNLRRRMGQAGRARVLEEFSWSRVIARYQAVWDDLRRDAARAVPPPTPADNPFATGPLRIFPHYATRLLAPGDQVVRAGGTLDEPPFVEVAAIVTDRLIRELLDLTARPAAIADLAAACDAPPGHVPYAVTWLLKYGYLRLVADAPERR